MPLVVAGVRGQPELARHHRCLARQQLRGGVVQPPARHFRVTDQQGQARYAFCRLSSQFAQCPRTGLQEITAQQIIQRRVAAQCQLRRQENARPLRPGLLCSKQNPLDVP